MELEELRQYVKNINSNIPGNCYQGPCLRCNGWVGFTLSRSGQYLAYDYMLTGLGVIHTNCLRKTIEEVQ